MHIFENTWYHGFIHEHSPGDSTDDTPQSRATKSLAYANLAAACVIAQAIDGLRDELKADEYGSLKDLALSIDVLAETLCDTLGRNGKEPVKRLIIPGGEG